MIDWHELSFKQKFNDQDNCVTVDHWYDGTMYEMKVLDELDKNENNGERKEQVVNMVLLVKKPNDKDWMLAYVHMLNYRTESDEIIYSDNDIYIDTEDYSITVIHNKKNKRSFIDACDDFLENLPEDVFHCNHMIEVDYCVIINYFYQWFAQKKTIDEINKCQIIRDVKKKKTHKK